MTRRGLWFLSAPIGAGKTTFCGALVDAARAAGWRVGGLISPGIFEDGIKTGIAVENLRTGERRTLARLSPDPDHDLAVGHRWFFSSAVMAWAATEFDRQSADDLYVVDELGPLEIRRGLGWTAALTALQNNPYRHGLVVIRPDLVEEAQLILQPQGVLQLPERTSPAVDFLSWLKKPA